MQWTYPAFMERMIKRYEGGYGWDKADTGGPTKYGITCFDLAEHMGQKMDSMSRWAPITKAMTLETAQAIYAKKYAAKVRYNELNAGVDALLMDYGVNSGVSRPIRAVRAILRVPGGVIMDNALVNAINAQPAAKVIDAVCAERLAFMHAIRGGSAWKVFGGGWGARVSDLRAYCKHLAEGKPPASAPVAVDLTAHTTPKAEHGNPNIVKNTATATGTGSVATTAATGGFGVEPWMIAVAVGAIVLSGIIFVVYQRQKALHLNAAVTPPIMLDPPPIVVEGPAVLTVTEPAPAVLTPTNLPPAAPVVQTIVVEPTKEA